MGREARCTVRYGRQTSAGKALLETSEILFRGEFRLKIPFGRIESVRVVGDDLVLKTLDGTAWFALGPAAAKWAAAILNPRSMLDKLGVKAGMVISVVGAVDAGLARDARARSATVSVGRLLRDSDLIFLFADSATKLARLKTARNSMRLNGGVWVVWPKGGRKLDEDGVRRAAKSAGLVDVKVVSYSPTQSGLKLVIPLANR